MKTKILASLFIFFILGACNSPELTELPETIKITFHIKGTVTDSTNNSSIYDAAVCFYIGLAPNAIVHTDNEGQYSITYYESEWMTWWGEDFLKLLVYASGYKDQIISDENENHVRLTEEWQTIDIQLEPESGGLR